MGSHRKYAHSWKYQTRRKKKGTFFVLFTIIFSLIIFTVRFIIVLPYFYIRDVRIRGLKRLSPSQLTAKINIPPHTSIFTLNLDKIYKSIESQPMVKRVIIKK
ncbi:MAG TPA: FtsQ-type POTRA domain-containing protein, partial [Candidatus Aerophobetes bacterium]|nr:FtsQ-type POTRA domain-containing protein [Candidatus Aerophobetes bacterium]